MIALAKAFKTSMLNRRGRDRESVGRKLKAGRRKRRGPTPLSKEPSSAEGSTSSEEEESSSSKEERKKKKRAIGKKKEQQMAEPEKGSGDIVSKMKTLVKDFADLKVHVVGGQERRKSPARLWANLLCTTCEKVGHANNGLHVHSANLSSECSRLGTSVGESQLLWVTQ